MPRSGGDLAAFAPFALFFFGFYFFDRDDPGGQRPPFGAQDVSGKAGLSSGRLRRLRWRRRVKDPPAPADSAAAAAAASRPRARPLDRL